MCEVITASWGTFFVEKDGQYVEVPVTIAGTSEIDTPQETMVFTARNLYGGDEIVAINGSKSVIVVGEDPETGKKIARRLLDELLSIGLPRPTLLSVKVGGTTRYVEASFPTLDTSFGVFAHDDYYITSNITMTNLSLEAMRVVFRAIKVLNEEFGFGMDVYEVIDAITSRRFQP